MEVEVLVKELGHLAIGLCERCRCRPRCRTLGEVGIGDERGEVGGMALGNLVAQHLLDVAGNLLQCLDGSGHAGGILLEGGGQREGFLSLVDGGLDVVAGQGLVQCLYGGQQGLDAVPVDEVVILGLCQLEDAAVLGVFRAGDEHGSGRIEAMLVEAYGLVAVAASVVDEAQAPLGLAHLAPLCRCLDGLVIV